MRNVILATVVVFAGIAANMGIVGTSGPSAEARPQAKASPSRLEPRKNGLGLSEDHPLSVLYDLAEPNDNGVTSPVNPALPGTVSVNLTDSKGAPIGNAKIAVSPPEDRPEEVCPSLPKYRYPLKVLIGTVPDPEHTHLALDYDRHVEAIIEAAQDEGYLFDRYWLPWREEEIPESADPEVRKKNEKEKEQRELLPGLLLFRKAKQSNEDPDKVLAVFLVGETPTFGINRHQFYRTECYIRALAPQEYAGILGPMYSGSAVSLKDGIDEGVKNSALPIRPVISGSTTGRNPKLFPDFKTTVHDDDVTYCSLVQVFPTWEPQRIAVLSEEDTDYGESLGRSRYDEKTKQKVDSSRLCGDTKPRHDKAGADDRGGPRQIYYPRDISHLRNAYQDDPALAASSVVPSPNTRRQLSLPLRDPQTGQDSVPDLSGQTPATQETVLFQIADVLKQGRFQAVIVRSTNVLDALFLSRFLRQCCGDVRVVVQDSDLLFVHGSDSPDYQGVISISSYPPSPAVRIPGTTTSQHIFSSNSEEGTYYAALMLLNEPLDTEKKETLFADYVARFSSGLGRPPVWISVVGRGSYWPIAAVYGNSELLVATDNQLAALPENPNNGYPTRVWDVVFYSAGLFVLLYVASYCYAVFRSPLKRWCADFHPFPDFHITDALPNRRRIICHLATSVFLVAGWCSLTFAPIQLEFGEGFTNWRWSARGAIFVIAVLLFVITHTVWIWTHDKRPVLITAGALTITMLLLALWLVPRSPVRQFRSLRSVDLASGVAPNLPLTMLFAVLAYCAWILLQRTIFVEERSTGAPALASLPGLMERNGPVSRIEFAINPRVPLKSRRTFLALVLGALSTTPAWFWLGTLESRSYERLFLILFALGAALLAGKLWQFVDLWHRLRTLLQRLDLHPIRRAFSALPPVSKWSPLWQSTARRRSWAIPQRSVDVLQMLKHREPKYFPYLDDALKSVQASLDRVMAAVQAGNREDPTDSHKFNSVCNTAAAGIESKLLEGEWGQGASETLEKIQRTEPKEMPPLRDQYDILAAEFIALRYVALIRYVMLHLRNKLSFLTAGFIFLAVAVNCYPFEGESYLLWWLVGVFVVLSSVVILVFVEMDRDSTLSRLTDTKAGEVDKGVYGRLISAGALPLIAVLSSVFPGIGRYLFAWLQPALSAMH